MRNNKRTLMHAIEHLRAYHKSNPDCFTRSYLNSLDALEHYAHQLISAACRDQLNDARSHHAFDSAQDLHKKLERKCSDHARKKEWQEEYWRREEEKYSPSQPRVPAGSPNGGEWTGGGGDSQPSRAPADKPNLPSKPKKPAGGGEKPRKPKPFKVDDAIQHAAKNAKPHPPKPGEGQCATYVREAITAGGVDIPMDLYKESAKDYGSTLENKRVGFHVQIRVQKGIGYPPAGYKPQKGDVVVIQSTSKSKDGHMAIYAGEEIYNENGKQKKREVWFSDFKQVRGAYPGPSYRNEKPSYVIYRHPDLID